MTCWSEEAFGKKNRENFEYTTHAQNSLQGLTFEWTGCESINHFFPLLRCLEDPAEYQLGCLFMLDSM
jgi:hypothetical protein